MADEFDLTPPADDDGIRTPTTRDHGAAAHRAKTIAVMHRRYGLAPGATCGQCVSLIRSGGGDGSWPKCKRFRVSCSEATDWRLKWAACGKFERREGAV